MATNTAAPKVENTVEAKLKALYELQQVDTQIDKIKQVRGELPLEVQDLEDELEGLHTRLTKLEDETKELDKNISERKHAIEESKSLIKKYGEQQANVRNNREYDSLTKEIEFQNLEIQLCEKRIREYKAGIDSKKDIVKATKDKYDERKSDLDLKKQELNDIIAETQREEDELISKAKSAATLIEERLFTAYNRIRGNARNGLAVVNVERDACGGCFSKIPPQRQMDIKSHKKIIVCENCGRILVDFLEPTDEIVAAPKATRSRGSRIEEDDAE